MDKAHIVNVWFNGNKTVDLFIVMTYTNGNDGPYFMCFCTKHTLTPVLLVAHKF